MVKAGLTAAVVFALATPALAASGPSDPFVQETARLHLDGLDLATVDGQNRLAIRMDAAARAVCGEGLAAVHLSAKASADECRTHVLANIRNQIETRMAAKEGQPQLAFNR